MIKLVERYFPGFLLLLFFIGTLNYQLSEKITPGFNFYDSKRILELILLIILALFFLVNSHYQRAWLQSYFQIPRLARHALNAILLLGIISSFFAAKPDYALIEVAVFSLLFCFSIGIAAWSRILLDRFHQTLMLLLVFSILYYSYSFFDVFIYFLSDSQLHTLSWFPGFINIRFFAQYSCWLLPIVCAAPLFFQAKVLKVISTLAAVMLWSLCLANAAKGLLLAMLLAYFAVLIMFARKSVIWCFWQALMFIGGVLLFFVLFITLPKLTLSATSFSHYRTTVAMKQHRFHHAAKSKKRLKRLTDKPVTETNLTALQGSISARLHLWHLAFRLGWHHPFFGVGPMHFAYYRNPIASHPHNSLLVFFSEWGIPVTLLVIGLALAAIFAWVKRFYQITENPLLTCSLTASAIVGLLYSLLSGVIIMPLAQIMTSVIIGWLLAYYQSVNVDVDAQSPVRKMNILAFNVVVVVLISVLIGGVYPKMHSLSAREIHWYLSQSKDKRLFNPRFWLQGWINTIPQQRKSRH